MEFYSSCFIFISNYYLLIVNFLLMLLFSLVLIKKKKNHVSNTFGRGFYRSTCVFFHLNSCKKPILNRLNSTLKSSMKFHNGTRGGSVMGVYRTLLTMKGLLQWSPHWLYLNDNAFPGCCKRHTHVTRDDDDRTVRDAFPLCLAVVVETTGNRPFIVLNDNMVWPVGGLAYHQESQKGTKQWTTLGIRINDTTVVDLRYFQPSCRLEEILFPSFALLVKQEHEQEMRSLT